MNELERLRAEREEARTTPSPQPATGQNRDLVLTETWERVAKAASASSVGNTVREHLATVPDQFLLWAHQRYGDSAIRAIRTACDQILTDMQKPSFKIWLKGQPVTDDAAGDAKADWQLPDAIGSWEALDAYLPSRDVDAGVC